MGGCNKFMKKINIDEDFEFIIVSSVRYSLGRRTYAVSLTCSYVNNLIPFLSNKTLSVMSRDIRNAPSLGDKNIDEPEWELLLANITKELGVRNKRQNKECI